MASYDAATNVGSLRDTPTNTTLTYGYDATGRLVSAIDSAVGSFGSLGYSYDKNGNRLSETRNASVLPYTYSPAGSNWLYKKGSDIRGKTPNGNTAGRGQQAGVKQAGVRSCNATFSPPHRPPYGRHQLGHLTTTTNTIPWH